MASKAEFTVAVVGWGRMGKHHASLAEKRGGRVVAVYDPHAQDVPWQLRYNSVTKALQQADVGIVAVPVGPRDEIADELLAAGRPLLVEKPLALRPSVARKWLRASQLVLLAENWSWSDWARAPRRSAWIMCFKPVSLEYVQPWVSDYAIGGGAFVEGGSHALTWWLAELLWQHLQAGRIPPTHVFHAPEAALDQLLQDVRATFVGDPMCGVLAVASRAFEMSLTLAIDWTNRDCIPAGYIIGLEKPEAGPPVQLGHDTSLHDRGFEVEWATFLDIALARDPYTLTEHVQRILVAGAAAVELLWEHVVKPTL